jgi:hypothetical protein
MSVASQDDSGSSRVPRPPLCGSVRELTLRKIKGGFWHRLRIIREKCCATLRSGLYLSGNATLNRLAPEEFSARQPPKNAYDSSDDFHVLGAPKTYGSRETVREGTHNERSAV